MSALVRLAEWWRWNMSCCGWRSQRHDWRDWRDGGCDCNCHEEIGYV
jgi:hypothetical protein